MIIALHLERNMGLSAFKSQAHVWEKTSQRKGTSVRINQRHRLFSWHARDIDHISVIPKEPQLTFGYAASL